MTASQNGPLAGRAAWRNRWRPVIETVGAAVLLVLYVALRTGDASRHWLELWYVAATAFAVAFPYGGLLLIIPVGMFIGPYLVRPGMPAWTIWIVAWAVGVLFRVAHALVRDRAAVRRTYGNPALLATLALLGASALSVVTSWRHYGRAIGTDAAYRWLWGPGTLLLVLLAAAWVVRDGRLRPLVLAVVVGVVAALISLVVWYDPRLVRDSAFAWLLGPQLDTARLHGVTYLATGLEALLIIPAAMLAMAALFAADRRVRLLSVLSLVPVALASWFTYNRAALVGAYVIGVVAAWQVRPRLGKVLAAVGAIGGAILLPWYMAFRGNTLGAVATASDGKLLSPSDQMRIDAWFAAARMFLDAPLLGHGFWSFYRLHAMYGSAVLDAPHNDWLRLFAEGGIIAGVAGIAFVVATVWTLSRGRSWLPRAVLAAFLCWALALCFNNIMSYDQVSIPMAVLLATGIALVRREREGALAAEPADAAAETDAAAHVGTAAPSASPALSIGTGSGTVVALRAYIRRVARRLPGADTAAMSAHPTSTRPPKTFLRSRMSALVVALAVLLGVVSAAGVPTTARAATDQPYATDTPLALWEVPVAQIPTAPTLGTNYLIKSFSPGMDPIPFLDAAEARGWQVIFHFNDTVDYSTGTVYPSRIAAWVNKVKDHPALAGYLTVKEPSWNGISVAEMRSLRNAFRAADPNPAHKIYADYGDSPHFGTSTNPWAAGIADVLIMNWYPVYISKGYISDAVKWFPRMRNYVNSVTPGTPIWIMTQAFGATKYNLRTPTSSEMAREVGEAFRYAGANGIVYYTWANSWYDHPLGTNTTLKTAITSINAQIRAGTFVVKASYDTTRPVMTSLYLRWSSASRKWRVNYHATDIAGIAKYQLRWRRGTTGTWTYYIRPGNSSYLYLALPRGKVTIQVRAMDTAGNWSYWRTVYKY